MGTRSDIIVQRKDGTWKRVYCHWDGYLSGVGATLQEYYNSQSRADAVVAPGGMSSLGEKCTKPAGHSFDNRKEGYTVYYARDRGEKNVDGKIGATLKDVWPPEDSWTEFTYVWTREFLPKGAWYVTSPEDQTSLILLKDALKPKGPKPKALVKVPFLGVIGQHHKV